MSTATVTVHNANSMTQRRLSQVDGQVELFTPDAGWIWVTAVLGQANTPISIAPMPELTELHFSVSADGLILSWIFPTSAAPVFLTGLKNGQQVDCYVGNLPKLLVGIAKTPDGEITTALSEILGSICGNLPWTHKQTGNLSETQTFDLLRGCAAVARRLGLFQREVNLLGKALVIRRSPNILRLLSYAHANAQDFRQAIVTAESAVNAKPELAEGPFQFHLLELQSYCDIAEELQQIAIARPRLITKNPNIAYCLHNSVPHAQGGYAIRSHSLAKAIGNRDRNLTAFARPGFPSDSGLPTENPNGELGFDGVRYYFENGFGRRGRTYGYLLEAADYYERVFTSNAIGLVHAATNFWTALPAAMAACRVGVPFVYEVRSFWSITREARSPGFAESPQAARDDALEKIVLAMADHVMTLNPSMHDRLIEMGVEKQRITIVPNCVDVEQFTPRASDPELSKKYGIEPREIVIGYMGAMLGYEGIDQLIEAAAPLIQGDSRIKLMIVGAHPNKLTDPTSSEYQIKRQIERNGLGKKITLVDRVPPDTAKAMYHLFDICAYPRRAFEVCELVSPLKPLEAMAAGKTVIGSNVGGLESMIEHERTGLLFDKEDVAQLRSVLKRAIDDQGLRERLGIGAQNFVRNERSWEMAAKIVDNVYTLVLSGQAHDEYGLADCIAAHFLLPAVQPKTFSSPRTPS